MRYKNVRFGIVLLALVAIVFGFYRCTNNPAAMPTKPEFVGQANCQKCHETVHNSFVQTAHFKTSAVATKQNLLGAVDGGNFEYYYSPIAKVSVVSKGDSLFQTVQYKGQTIGKASIDFIFGSGKKGQSHLSWKRGALVQLPLTYFTPANAWSISPGFSTEKIAFNRVITSRCLECHTAGAAVLSQIDEHPERFDAAGIQLGIQCETCHGPGSEHIKFHKANPSVSDAQFIVHTTSLSRQQQLDLCAYCHNGSMQKLRPSFSFKPGDTLAHFFVKKTAAFGGLDVHGNQLALLEESACFKRTSLTCTTCHDPHQPDKNTVAAITTKCIGCHPGFDQQHKNDLAKNVLVASCIDCHMPKQPSQSIAVFLQGNNIPTPAYIRTHRIASYQDLKNVQ